MPLTPEQQKILATFLRRSRANQASPVERKALIEAGLVESNLTNPHHGDADSLGSLQERTSIYGAGHALSPSASADRFLADARKLKTPGVSAGALAQLVQRSAFPARYAQRGGEADALLAGAPSSSGSSAPSSRTTTRTTPGVDRSGERRALILRWLQTQHQPGALVSLATGLQGAQDTPAKTVRTTSPAPAASGSSQGAATARVDGKPVASWIAPILQYAKQRGWQGTVQSGYRSVAEQARIYDSGVRPAAKPGQSNHNFTAFPGGAVDVTNAQQLAQILQRSPYAKKLVWAGSKDQVHFSHPHGGGY